MARGRRFQNSDQWKKPKEQASPNSIGDKGPWSHVKRQPTKIYTKEEREDFARKRGWK